MTLVNKTPAITSASLPKPAPEAAAHAPIVDGAAALDDRQYYEQAEARSLTAPDFINIKPKNPAHALRWINFKVGKDESSLRYEQALAQGYRNATTDDVQKVSNAYVRDGGKRIINGDLILMLHSRAAYVGALKKKDEQARFLASKTEITKGAKEEVKKVLADSGAPAETAHKVSVFVPSAAEIEGLVGKDD